jgi:polysaccharide export outer membrane protein
MWFALALASISRAGAQQPELVIGPNDLLTVTVWNQPALSGKFTVQADGTFAFPLVGRLAVSGLAPRQVEETIARLLSDGYVKEPQVSLAVERNRAATIYVTGEVRQPGAYPIVGDVTLVEMLAKAGSTTDKAGSSAVVTRPRSTGASPPPHTARPGAPQVIRVNLDALQNGLMNEPVVLRDGDTVFVPRADIFYVVGEVRNPGSYVLRDPITVLQALALAGGLTERGSDKRIQISRIVDGRPQESKVTLGESLQPGDTVIVGERRF